MKHVNLPNFRYMTGHGKQFAEAVDQVLQGMDDRFGGGLSEFADYSRKSKLVQVPIRIPCGVTSVYFDPQTGEYDFKFVPFPNVAEKIKEPTTTAWRVCCILRANPVTMVNVPLNLILNDSDLTSYFQLYEHTFTHSGFRQPIEPPNSYVGVTRRSWGVRWKEHLRSAANGSHYRFHEAIRQNPTSWTQHLIHGLYATEKDLMAAEEHMVNFTLHPKGLNMVPGGYAGIAFLHKMGLVGKRERVSPDEKHEFIDRFFQESSRKGMSNLAMMRVWQDALYAEKVICGAPDRLKPDQIRQARYLESIGRGVEEIATEVGARNPLQIDRLLKGRTYSRIN